MLVTIPVARNKGKIIVPKDQTTFTYLQETDKFTDGQRASLLALTPEDRKVKVVLLGITVMHDSSIIPSHPKILEASCLTKWNTPTKQVLVI